MRSSKVLSSIAISSMLILMVMVLPVNTQAAWSDSATITFSPEEMFPGETYPATYTLDIASGVDATQVTITQVLVQYEWEATPSPIFSGIETITSFPYQHIFSHDVQVPEGQAASGYSVVAQVAGYLNGSLAESFTTSFSGTVAVADPVSATATADPATGLAPQEVSFTATPAGGTSPYTYSWNFGDGSAVATQKNPKHTYIAGGTFTATVTVTDNLGRTATADTAEITITPGVTVTIGADHLAGPLPLDVAFTNEVTNAADGDLTYAWDFGDGGTSTEATPTHTFAEAGDYSVKLNVTDSLDRKGTSNTLTIRVSASVNPIASISSSTDSGRGPLSVDFTSTVSGGTYPYEYEWDFNDGATSTEANPSHTFDEPGIYVVTLKVTDAASRQDTSGELTITVISNTNMEVVISTASANGSAPLTVAFNSTILNGTSPFFYRWSFGDGVNSTQANPTHVYDTPGSYKVTLTVTDSDSNVMISNNLTIAVGEPPVTTLPAWVWIWSATGVIIAAVGVIGFVMMRRKI